MKVAFNKTTNQYINDFQSGATEACLIINAMRSGLGLNQIEIRDLGREEYKNLEVEMNEPSRILLKQLEEEKIDKAVKLKDKLKLTEEDVEILKFYFNR